MLTFLLVVTAVFVVGWLALKLLLGLVVLPFKLLFALISLPFKILGAILRGVSGVLGGVFGVLGGVALVVAGVVLVPLLPLLLLGGLAWLLIRAVRPRPVPAEVRVIRA
jgi:hypothetical protein